MIFKLLSYPINRYHTAMKTYKSYYNKLYISFTPKFIHCYHIIVIIHYHIIKYRIPNI